MTPTTTQIQERIDQHLAALRHLYGLLDAPRPTGERLTARELEVLTLRASSPLTMRQIGRRLGLSEDAAKSAAKRGWAKLGITHPGQLPAALARLDEVAA